MPHEPIGILGAAAGPVARAAWRDDDRVVAVDWRDNELGPVSRATAYRLGGTLHRAFMVLLVDESGRFVLARRSAHKRLWPMFWADSCAGHPGPGQGVWEAASKRTREELGCSLDIVKPFGRFEYKAHYGDLGCEHELCYVLVGRTRDDVVPDPAEVAEIGIYSPEQLVQQLEERPDDFAPWLRECFSVFPPESLAAEMSGR